MDIYTMANQKGGVGKTANTINLGAGLAEHGRRVLLVDWDPQGHMTEALGVSESPDDRTMKRWALGEWTGDPHELIVDYRPHLHVLPTNVDMFLLDKGLYATTAREMRLAKMLSRFEADYDDCIIDAPPSLGIGTECALMAARKRPGARGGLFVPVEAEDSSIRALRLLLRQVAILSAEMDVDIDILGLIPTRFDMRDGEIVSSMLEAFRGLGSPPVIAEIKKRTDIRKAWRAKVPVLEFDPKCEASQWFRDLAKVVLAA
ncbi:MULTISPECIES: ParA family protein [unclassified Streptomyces]|uniref:ParA family protein n=1 Tax=unclassified Streptomyces TaxID=2593676 RepID=UPI00224E4087|nr:MULTISPECIES: ParA family protein [unclassified Streptomyces]MCX4871111.1 ParA family protein [Streptomyces sp. NBC_00906]MCX4902733.1 ParA family protein [Streptomyces sp. NBC_00892]